MLIGQCHCGDARVSVSHSPERVLECHCSICGRYAALWSYYPVGEISLTGATDTYAWGPENIDFHRCSRCGCVMAWLPRGDHPTGGVNARMLEGFSLQLVEHTISDG
jgi:hypothetical protein